MWRRIRREATRTLAEAVRGSATFRACVAGLAGALLPRGDLDRAVDLVREALTVVTDEAALARLRRRLGVVLLDRYEARAHLGDLEEAITALRGTRDADPVLARALVLRRRAGVPGADDEGLAIMRELAGDPDDPDRAKWQNNVGAAYTARYEVTGDPVALDAAIQAYRAAVAAAPDADARLIYLTNLGLDLVRRFTLTTALDDLDHSIEALRAAVSATAPGSRSRPLRLNNLANSLLERAKYAGSAADVDEAVALLDEALRGPVTRVGERLAILSNRVGARALRQQIAVRPGDADAAIADAERLLAEARATGTLTHLHLNQAGLAYLARYLALDDDADLDRATALLTDAIAAGGVDFAMQNLGLARLRAYQDRGMPADLDNAIAHLRAAIDQLAPRHLQRWQSAANLGAALWIRYGFHGTRADLDDAIGWLTEAVEHSDGAHRTVYLSTLALAYRARFELVADPADLDAAVHNARAVLRYAPPTDVRYPTWLNNVGSILHSSFDRTADRDELDEAEYVLRQAVEAEPSPIVRAGLADVLLTRDGRDRDATALAEAAAGLREALAGSPESRPQHGELQFRVGLVHRTGDDCAAAIEAFQAAYRHDLTPADRRIQAAVNAAELALESAQPARAAEAYRLAVDLLPVLAWRGLGRGDQEHRLGLLAGTASDAAACALLTGAKELTVELLERGRTVLWSQALDRGAEITALRRADPELADRLLAARAALDGAPA